MSFFDDALRALNRQFDEFSTNALRALNMRFDSLIEHLERRIGSIDRALHLIAQMESQNMATLADIQDKVTEQQTVIGSAVTLLEQLSQMLRDAAANSADPAQLAAIADMLDSEKRSLADAVAANTPSAPNPVR
jgi:methyl-accepting chemotaxis protein